MRATSLDSVTRARLRDLLDLMGGVGAERVLDVPVGTIHRAAAGDPLRRATITAIRLGLARRRGE